MLTRKELDLVERYAKLISTTYQFPLDWENGQLRPTTSKIKKILVLTNFIAFTIYMIFVLARFSDKFGGTTPNSMPFHSFAAICHGVFFVFHIHAFLYGLEMATLFNQLTHFNLHTGRACYGHDYLIPGNREKAILYLHRWICGSAIALCFGFLIMPTNSYYAYSVLPEEWQTVKMIFVFLPIEILFAFKILFFHTFLILYGFYYTFSTDFWLNLICVEWANRPELTDTAFRIYRTLGVLNSLYNTSLASFVIPIFKSFVELGIVVCAYGTIRLYGKINISAYVFLPMLPVFAFTEYWFSVSRMAAIHECSSHFRHNYRLIQTSRNSKSRRKYMDKFLRSCRPLRCQLTSALFVEKSTKLLLLSRLLNMLTSLLISLKVYNA